MLVEGEHMRLMVVLLGGIFLALAIIYFTVPADALPLPGFLGYQAGLTKTHAKHGIVAIVLAIACFAFAWLRDDARSAERR
jgi:hypothetical protein